MVYTSKFGQHYGTYDIVDSSGEVLIAGLREMSSGNTDTQLEVLKGILKELEESLEKTQTNVSKKIVSSIKNIMSDRHIVQKKFNAIFQDYRAGMLPEVIKGWGSLNENEQLKISKVNDFFCGMHYVVGLADQSEVALKAWDKLLFGDLPVGSIAQGGYNKGESGTYRLIRTLCKAVQTRGCEKSGRIADFSSYLIDEVGLSSVPFITFKGNRFNILFYNGGITYYLHEHCKHFFDGVKEDNKLLKAVFHDLQVPAYISGCRALGLINKFVTGPLWRLLESGIHILDMNQHYQRMEKLFSDLSVDASPFLAGNLCFFDGINITKDKVYEELIRPSEFDESTKQCLELIFGSLSIVTKRMLNDHLEGGKYNTNNGSLRSETASVSTTNSLAERNFGMLDRLISEKANANMITYEAIIMVRTNKTSEWRDKLTPERRRKLMRWARESTNRQYEDFRARRAEVRRKRNEKRLDKLEEKRKRESRIRLIKEELCSSIQKFGGLWLTVEQIDSELASYTSNVKKQEALKCQIQFRQKVLLSSPSVNKKLFFLSEKGKNKSIAVLTENLKILLQQLQTDKHIGRETFVLENLPSVLPRNKLSEEKSRLKSLLDLECRKLEKRREKDNTICGPPEPKKTKCDSHVNMNLHESIPVVTCIDELIGKRVEHFTFDYNGKEKWYNGVVVCLKPDTASELVIRYDCEETLYSFDYSEFLDSLVRLVPIFPQYLLGKKIRQRFVSDDETDMWWETGSNKC